MGGLERFYQAYLVAYTFWLGIALGSLALLMVQHLTGGAWGVVIRRPLEAAVSTLPVMALLFLPIVPGMHDLYHWTHADALSDPVIAAKAAYLNTPFFLARAAFYFAVWIGISQLLLKWSKEQDATGDPVYASKLSYLSAPRPAGLHADGHLRHHRLADVGEPALVLDDVGPAVHGRSGAGRAGAGHQRAGAALGHGADEPRAEPLAFPRPRQIPVRVPDDVGVPDFSQFLIVYSANLQGGVPHYLARRQDGYEYVTSRWCSCTSSCPTSSCCHGTSSATRRGCGWWRPG